MEADDRRLELRRLDDVRELLRFCLRFGQTVPSRVVARLQELGVAGADRRPIPELLAILDEMERPAVQALVEDRRRGPRRWLNPELIEDDDL